MSKELFVVKNRSNVIVAKGFSSKKAAKEARDSLQKQTSEGMPGEGEHCQHRKWSFSIARGKDHRLSS